jgi:hypothetical protein
MGIPYKWTDGLTQFLFNRRIQPAAGNPVCINQWHSSIRGIKKMIDTNDILPERLEVVFHTGQFTCAKITIQPLPGYLNRHSN